MYFRKTHFKKFTGTPTVSEPFTFELSSKKEIILDVEITVPPGRVASIKLRKNDSIESVVGTFAKKWELTKQTESKIFDQIVEHLIQSAMFNMTREGKQQREQDA
jgi:hypothetical protein